MIAQQQFTCRNMGEGYLVLTVNEFDRMFYVVQKDNLPENMTVISREMFDIIKKGLLRHDFVEVNQNSAEAVDDKYIWALWMCISNQEVSLRSIMQFCSIDLPNANKIIFWMERMKYISHAEDDSYKILISMDEFILLYGNLEF